MNNLLSQASRAKLINNFLVLGLAVYGIAKKNYHEDRIPYFEKLLVEAFGPIQRGTMNVKQSFSHLVDNYLKIVDTNEQNAMLQKKVKDLENVIFQLGELRSENQRLKELLRFGEEIPRQKVLAQVVGWDSSTEFNVLRINKGRKDGITLKSTVVTAEGVVGYVYRVAENYSDILTILDQNNRVDTIVSRTRSHGIVEGFSNFSTTMKYVNRNEPVEVNDTVITAGLGNIYPKGLMVGTIKKIERENYGITQLIEVKPSVDFHKLEEVIVLLKDENDYNTEVVSDNKSVPSAPPIKPAAAVKAAPVRQ